MGTGGNGGTTARRTQRDGLGGKAVDFLRAEHGFSALVEVRAGDRTRRVLFDTGISPDGLVGNIDRLGIGPTASRRSCSATATSTTSWGSTGWPGGSARGSLPVLLHRTSGLRRRIVGPGRDVRVPGAGAGGGRGGGFTIVEDRQPSFLLDGMLLVTGEVDRTTDFETGMPPAHQAFRDGAWAPDRLVHDDQAIVVHVRDKGLVVLTGCGHSGIVNIVRYAKRLTGVDHVYAILGGLHLRDGEVVRAR